MSRRPEMTETEAQPRVRRSTSRDVSRQSRRRTSYRSEKDHDAADHDRLSRELSRHSTRRRGVRWWKIRWFKGMVDDVKRRAPFYLSDWTDAWDYRVVPATVYMYFAKYVATITGHQTRPSLQILTLHFLSKASATCLSVL